ncbi:MAG TPA: septum formation initiator family protein [Bryobacteraceae bacterium]|jgi:cell division protein FtsB|nr:septum formation initiator family protein [Bryobacteraceae bacterium]
MMLPRLFRPLAAAAALIGLGAYAAIMLRGPQGVSALREKQQEIRQLEEQNATLRRDIDKEKDRIERLKNDPKTQEVELEKLGLVHKDDTQFKIAGQQKTDK